MDRADEIPPQILDDPRHLIPKCDGCEHRLEEGLCGLDLHPVEAWKEPGGCRDYAPLEIEGGGDPNGEEMFDY